MATPQRHEEFNKEYDYDYATRSGWNVQNARVTSEYASNETPTPANNNYRPITRYANNQRARYEQNTPANTNEAPTGAAPRRKKTSNPATNLAAQIAVKPISAWIWGWTTFIYFFQAPVALVSALMLGAAFEVSNNWLASAVNTALYYVGSVIGLESLDIMTLFFVATGLCFILTLCSLGFSWLTYTLCGIHSYSGETGAGLKKTTFMLTLFMSIIPGMNFFPWIWLWIAAVTFFPK